MSLDTTTTTAPGGPAVLRANPASAAEAPRRGDHAAADAHEHDAPPATRAALAYGRGEARA